MERLPDHTVPPLVLRLRTVAVCLLLTLLAFLQTPGRIAVDTKLDLTADPVRFMGRALHLWDPQAAFGQLQNQATGYLFPMGPFFALGHLVSLPPWIVQRLWWSLLMIVAFLGFRAVAERLGIGSPLTRALLGLAFAASPRVVSVLGATSVEALPLCLTPWVLLPLVDATVGRVGPRRGAALSGLAVLCIGGVNAVATLAALPSAGLFVLCHTRAGLRRRLVGWWVVSVTLATLWWLIPLILLGRYSPPFLDYIEPATVTTGITSLPEALRGTSDWIGFLATGQGPVWPAAWRLVTDPATVLNTLLLAALGLYGLSRRRLPYRGFLLLSTALGLFLVSLGHVGTVDGLLAPELRAALDGGLAPLRNVHKFDAVLRLPLMLAACHALSCLSVPDLHLARWRLSGNRFVHGVALVVLAGTLSPLLLGLAVPRGSYTSIPEYWRQTAKYVADQHVPGRTLLLPGSPFADYLWGRTGDEPLQPLATSPWAVRNGIPLAPAGNIRLLDGIQERLRHGEGSAGLTDALERSGVGLLVVRNDLDWAAAGAPRPLLVHQALQDSPGINLVASFGPRIAPGSDERVLADAGLHLPYPAVEVFRVESGGERVTGYPVATTLSLAGGTEALLDGADQGVTSGRATTLAGQGAVPGASGHELVTDTLRHAEVPFSSLPGDVAPLAAEDPFRTDRPAHDYLPVAGIQHQTVLRYLGVRRVLASSSGSDVNAQLRPGAQYAPSAAFDGEDATFWHSGRLSGAVGQWLQVDLARPVDVKSVRLRLALGRPLSTVAAVTVTTDQGSVTSPVSPLDVLQTLPVRPGLTTRVRVTAASVVGGGRGTGVGVRELSIPEVLVDPTLVTPGPASQHADFLLAPVPLGTDGCARAGDRPLCSPLLVTPDVADLPVDRVLTTPTTSGFGLSVTARPRPGPAVDRLLDQRQGVQVTASSVATADPASRPGSVFDHELGTGWVASAADPRPTLHLHWASPRAVSSLQLLVDASLAASRPRSVTIVAGATIVTVPVGSDGTVAFPRITTTRLDLAFNRTPNRLATDERTGAFTGLPIGVSEVLVPTLEDLRTPLDPRAAVTLPCGSGPTVSVDGQTYATRVETTVGALLSRRVVGTYTCSTHDVPLLAGQHHLVARSSEMFETRSLRLTDLASPVPPTAAARPVRAGAWGDERRQVAMGSGPATVLVVHENANAGWRATLGGHVLHPLIVDGWQQAWIVPMGGAGTVHLAYTPGGSYRLGLVVGVVALVALVGLALFGRRSRAQAVEIAVRQTSRPAVVLSAALLVLAGGPAAVFALAVGGALAYFLPRRDVPAAVVGTVVLVLAGLAQFAPWPTARGLQSGAAQVAVLLAVAVALLSASDDPDPSSDAPRTGS